MAMAVALPVLDVVTVAIVVKVRYKNLLIVLTDVRIAPYGVAVRQE